MLSATVAARFREISLLRRDQSKLVVRLYTVRFEFDGLLQVSGRFWKVAVQPQSISQIEACHEIVWPKIQGFAEVVDRLIEVAERTQHRAKIVLDLNVVRVQLR